ncbi:S-adenosyl-L-methionine-dependent methyltransferase [Phyllosticta citricarpa]|uniref:S-adenosyl-L-methionine-dependent methyltransferase n=2 Tax=Phyllosticta TaxID=121621 RepID=A0ABR1L3A4_9PEZI
MFNPEPLPYPVPADASDRYDRKAQTYDETVGASEKSIGVNRLRRKLVRQAEGHVLEVSAGTGPSLPHYDFKKVRSLTLLDQSGPMLEIARHKWNEMKQRGEIVGRTSDNVEFRVQSAFDPIEGPKYEKDEKVEELGKFDTVVQAHGLCSTAQPERLLQRLGQVVKRDGKILLLEHGYSYFGWLNLSLDLNAPVRADKYGCWWNKDIGAIVQNSGLEVVKISRPWYHLGTTWWIELRRNVDAEQDQRIEAEADLQLKEQAAAMAQQQDVGQKRGWLW